MVWIYFAAIAAVIIFAGSRLSIFADQLADLLKLSRSAVGILMVSIVTTLPELSTTLGAIIKVGEPNLALGNNLGSVLFNLMIIAICDLVFRKAGILRQAKQAVPMLQSLLIIGIVLLTLILPNNVSLGGFNFAAGSVLLIIVYIVVFMLTHRKGNRTGDQMHEEFGDMVDQITHQPGSETTLTKALSGFLLSAVVVVACGITLASLGDRIAFETGLDQSFVGTLFLAIATSLPELTVGITSVKIGAYDMMIGNVAGANMLNVLVIAIADLIHRPEALHIPDNLSSSQLVSGGAAITTTILVIVTMRQKKKARLGFGWESLVMLAIYGATLFMLYKGVLS